VPTARTLRLNELLQRELSGLLHSEYQAESVTITIGGVDVAPDLSGCRVHVAVTGDDALAADRLRWLRRQAGALRSALARRIVLKHLPALTFELDSATQRGNRILAVLDEIVAKEPTRAGEVAAVDGVSSSVTDADATAPDPAPAFVRHTKSPARSDRAAFDTAPRPKFRKTTPRNARTERRELQ
jgi:ribosome-binding factor A